MDYGNGGTLLAMLAMVSGNGASPVEALPIVSSAIAKVFGNES